MRITHHTHPQPLHDRPRSVVRRRCERDDIRERESAEPVAKRQAGRFRCITLSPMLEGQAPADLHAGRERGFESRDGQSGETDKRRCTRDLDGPQTKAAFAEVLFDAINQRVALNSTEATREEFHDSRIRIHGGKRFPILITPSTQADACAGQCNKGAHHRASLCPKGCNGEPGADDQPPWPLDGGVSALASKADTPLHPFYLGLVSPAEVARVARSPRRRVRTARGVKVVTRRPWRSRRVPRWPLPRLPCLGSPSRTCR